LHGFLQDGHQQDMSSTTEQSAMTASSLMNASSNNLALALQGHHHQEQQDHQQLLSSFGSELLLSPTSPYGFQSSLLRSLMEPTAAAAAKPQALPGYQQYDQYQQMGMGQARFAPAGATREALQFTNDAPFWNPSAAGFGVPPAPAAANQASSVRSVKPSPTARTTATLALKVGIHIY
jgi:hypothetical protein